MTDIEKQALALIAEIRAEQGTPAPDYLTMRAALIRAIEQHEAFRQEVSDAVAKHWGDMPCEFDRFIVAKPDPLVEAWLEAFPGNHIDDAREECAKISAVLAARGLKIVEVGHD